MEGKCFIGLLFFLVIQHAITIDGEKIPRISLFNVVTFPNVNCVGTGSKNGTCYTKEQCKDRDGTEMGECAQGYGICCLISLSCGGRSNENITYMEMTTTTAPPKSCEYELCPANTNVARIRLDFEIFTIEGPSTQFDPINTSGAPGLRGGAVGDCRTDSFSVSGTQFTPPVICGTNAGQHVYVDVVSGCIKPEFQFGTSVTKSRKYTLKATQYVAGEEMGGPPGCMQYFTSTTGTVRSFNFPSSQTSIKDNSAITHLSEQYYDICFRRAAKNCRLCFTPEVENAAGTVPSSFGLSKSSATTNYGVTGTNCDGDFLIIPQMVNAATTNPIRTNVQPNIDRICGRRFTTNTGAKTTQTICTSRVPFAIKFRADQDETTKFKGSITLANDERACCTAKSTTLATGDKQTCTEVCGTNGGNVPGYLGFSLKFFQESC